MRKPIEFERKGLQTPRERVWAAIRQLRTGFTVWSVQDTAMPLVGFDAAMDYIRELEAAGYVRQVSGSKPVPGRGGLKSRPTFDLVKDSPEPPQLLSGGKPAQGTGVLAMWRSMKVMTGGFSIDDLVRAASVPGVLTVTRLTAQAYVLALTKAGYLKPDTPLRSGVTNRWRLVRNTGPHAPAITRRKCVFDRNTGTFAELQTAQEVCDGLE